MLVWRMERRRWCIICHFYARKSKIPFLLLHHGGCCRTMRHVCVVLGGGSIPRMQPQVPLVERPALCCCGINLNSFCPLSRAFAATASWIQTFTNKNSCTGLHFMQQDVQRSDRSVPVIMLLALFHIHIIQIGGQFVNWIAT